MNLNWKKIPQLHRSTNISQAPHLSRKVLCLCLDFQCNWAVWRGSQTWLDVGPINDSDWLFGYKHKDCRNLLKRKRMKSKKRLFIFVSTSIHRKVKRCSLTFILTDRKGQGLQTAVHNMMGSKRYFLLWCVIWKRQCFPRGNRTMVNTVHWQFC